MITVNLKTGEVGQASDTLYATNATAAAPSSHRMALCGGDVAQKPRDYCQVYSPERDEYVHYLDIKLQFSGLFSHQVGMIYDHEE